MSFLVDTDICSAHLKDVRAVTSRFLQYSGRLHVSTVTVAELYTWVLRAKASPRHGIALETLLEDLTVLAVDRAVSLRFGEIRSKLLDQGQDVAGMDLLIAATASVHGLTVVTHNTKDFRVVTGLSIVDWLAP